VPRYPESKTLKPRASPQSTKTKPLRVMAHNPQSSRRACLSGGSGGLGFRVWGLGFFRVRATPRAWSCQARAPERPNQPDTSHPNQPDTEHRRDPTNQTSKYRIHPKPHNLNPTPKNTPGRRRQWASPWRQWNPRQRPRRCLLCRLPPKPRGPYGQSRLVSKGTGRGPQKRCNRPASSVTREEGVSDLAVRASR
jgi:hypothetical protein